MTIGKKVWFRGDELTITSEPFELYGGQFVEAVNADGKLITVPTDAQRKLDADANKKAHRDMQAGFRKLKG